MQLIGIKEIARHLGLSEATAIDMIQLQGMPAEKNPQSIWVSSTESIEGWQNRDAGKKEKAPTSLGDREPVKLVKAATTKKISKGAKKAQTVKDGGDGENEADA